MLQSQASGYLYVGQTSDLERRLDEHFQGVSRYTRGRGPWSLVYHEAKETRADAIKRERFLKSGQGREWLKLHLREVLDPTEAH